jgi:[lysine-biosynthesis-protein LysW]--L-2-aminoadipate ligase
MAKSIGLVYDRIRWDEKAILDKARRKGIELKIIDAKKLCLDAHSKVSEIRELFGDIVLQRCISYFRGLHLTGYLESKETNVINSYDVSQICGNKMLTTLALVKSGIPTPRTYITFSADYAIEAVEKMGKNGLSCRT